MKNWFARFPTILQGCESTIEMLRGQYAHSVGCFDEAAFHFLEAMKVFSAIFYISFPRSAKHKRADENCRVLLCQVC